MALTKITGGIVSGTSDYSVRNLSGVGATFTGNVSVGGTLTYEDVTSIESVGVITAKNNIDAQKDVLVGAGVSVVGVTTSTGGFVGALTGNVTGNITGGATGDFSIADKIVHTGDTNTAIRFPSADTVSIETAGTQIAKFTSSGNFELPNDNDYIKIGTGGDLTFVHTGSESFISNHTGHLTRRSDVHKWQSLDGSSEYVRITSAGSVGINSVSPDRRFTLNQDATCRMNLKSLANSTAGIEFGDHADHNAGYIVYDNTDNSFQVGLNGTGEKLRITSGGAFLLGATATSNAEQFRIHTADSGKAIIKCTNSGTGSASGDGFEFGLNGSEHVEFWHKENHPMYFATNNTEKLRITAGGHIITGGQRSTIAFNNVGNDSFGSVIEIDGSHTTDHHGMLSIVGKSDTDTNVVGRIQFVNSQNSSGSSGSNAGSRNLASIEGRMSTSDSNAGDDSGGYLRFVTKAEAGGNAERFRIGSNGNLAVGGNAGIDFSLLDGMVVNAGNGSAGVLINSTSSSHNAYLGFSYGTGSGTSHADQFSAYIGRLGDNTLIFGTNNGIRQHITSTGRLLYGNHINDRGAELQYEGDQHACIGIHRNTANHGAPAMHFSASRGTSAGSNTVVQSGDYLGMLSFKGADGSDLANGAYITAIVDGTPGSDDMPTRLGFWTSPDGSQTPAERFRIDSSGKFCFGTITSGYENNDSVANFVKAAGAGTENPLLTLWNPTTVGDARASIDFLTNTGSGTGRDGAFIRATNNGVDGRAHIAFGELKDETYTERMRLTSSGELFVNTTSSVDGNTSKGLHVYNTGGSMASFKRAQSGAGLRFIHVNTLSGWIEFNSNNTVSYTSASDYRLKENNVPISDGIARVKNLKPYRFNWKAEPDKTVDGFFAHEAQEVVPESATRSKDRVVTEDDLRTGYVKAPMKVGDPIHQSMDNAKLIPLLTAALKEAIAKIEVLETKVAALESS